MKTLLLSSFIIFHLIVLGQRPEKINVIDDGRPAYTGFIVIYGIDKPQLCYPDSTKVEEGNYIDNRKEGTWIKYHIDGITTKFIGEYEHNRPKGKYSKYYDTGQLREVGYFTKNRYRDSLIRYHRNGNREYAAFYDSLGKENGMVTYWLEDGTIEFEYETYHGILKRKKNGNGITNPGYYAEICYTNTTANPVFHSCNNPAIGKETPPKVDSLPKTNGVKWQPDGSNKIFTSDNEILQDGVFKNGQLWDGRVYVYDRDGILLKIKVFKSGLYHSDGQI